MSDIKNKSSLSEEEFLRDYDISKFERPSVTVDILIFTILNEVSDNYRKLPSKDLKVLLIKRNEHPYLNKWALPGGFVRIDEDLQTSVYRELKEETNVENVYLEQLYTYGDINRDPRGRIISTAYMSLMNSEDVLLIPGTDANEAKWFSVSSIEVSTEDGDFVELIFKHEDILLKAKLRRTRKLVGTQYVNGLEIFEKDDLAFDHSKIIQYGLERLRNKAEFTGIVFNLMSELFTLSELQISYEIILDKKLLKANFRRKVAKMVEETDEFTGKHIGHRPAKLYRYKSNWNLE